MHGGIDGFSRIPVYLSASTNNRSETVLRLFLEAVSKYSLPGPIRVVVTTCCSILVGVLAYGSFITGRSVHNQRIERLWRDVFFLLHETLVSDPIDELGLFALHLVFLSRINKQLMSFREAYCRHRLQTEHNQTPLQLWTRGMLVTEDATALARLNEINKVGESCQ
jgi:hypothetical protein